MPSPEVQNVYSVPLFFLPHAAEISRAGVFFQDPDACIGRDLSKHLQVVLSFKFPVQHRKKAVFRNYSPSSGIDAWMSALLYACCEFM